jgi:hypothetical protein
VSNKTNWMATEEKLFQEIYSLGHAYELNKSLTKEAATPKGLMGVRLIARNIA